MSSNQNTTRSLQRPLPDTPTGVYYVPLRGTKRWDAAKSQSSGKPPERQDFDDHWRLFGD